MLSLLFVRGFGTGFRSTAVFVAFLSLCVVAFTVLVFDLFVAFSRIVESPFVVWGPAFDPLRLGGWYLGGLMVAGVGYFC